MGLQMSKVDHQTKVLAKLYLLISRLSVKRNEWISRGMG